jgi:release factor glutamine methyltransferase
MKLMEMRSRMQDELRSIYPEREIPHIWDHLVTWATGMDRPRIALEPDRKLEEGEFENLIPRPETEELVHWILEDHKNRKELKVLDIGTGSGCIALALGKLLDHPYITAIDISKTALKIAGRNFIRHQIDTELLEIDILDRLQWPDRDKYDIIVSNPPYVRNSEKQEMHPNVLRHEPANALFVDDADPLLFYRAIGEFARKNLAPGGRLYFEINEKFGMETVELMQGFGFQNIELKRDMQGKHRMLKASGIMP